MMEKRSAPGALFVLCIGGALSCSLVPTQGQRPVAVLGTPDLRVTEQGVIVVFDGSKSYATTDGKLNAYIWDYGDGSAPQALFGESDKSTKPTHTYLAAQNAVTIKLVVQDDDGLSSDPATQRVFLRKNQAPTAKFALTPTTGVAPLITTLDGTGSSAADPNENSLLQYQWDFGDGPPTAYVTNPVIQHIFKEGLHTISLRVRLPVDGQSFLESTPVYQTLTVTSGA